jgi:putative addiction module component (TIGR02574 family)
MSATEILEQIEHLPRTEQQVVAEMVWEKFGAFGDELTPEQSAELDRRLADFEKNPHDGIPWEQAETKLNKRFGWQ